MLDSGVTVTFTGPESLAKKRSIAGVVRGNGVHAAG